MNLPDLVKLFTEWNLKAFQGQLLRPELRWNSRLKATAGRFIPDPDCPVIEIATYLNQEENAEYLIKDTLGHEMIHYWLFMNERPFGHGSEFYQKMEAIGVSRYNPVPKHRPFKHCYVCDHCEQKILVRKRLKTAACADCCNLHANGQYHPEYNLRLEPLPIPAVDLPKRA